MANQELKHFVRIANNDIIGKKTIIYGLAKIDGIGYSTANAICKITKIDSQKKTGYLTQDEVKKIEEVIQNQNLPDWMKNRKKDRETGKNIHLVSPKLKLTRENDIKLQRKIKSYRGMRHSIGQPVRGQRTRSHFRKGSAVGVTKSKAKGKKG